MNNRGLALLSLILAASAPAEPQPDQGALLFDSLPEARFEFAGLLGERVDANVQNWLLTAPQANPGMLEMFRLRDRGRDQMLLYSLPAWPEKDFTIVVRVRIDELPTGRIGQVFSAWAAGMDDPLRLVVDNGRLFARIEAGSSFSTPGAVLEPGRWRHVAAARRGATLTLFVDGQAVGSSAAPEFMTTAAHACALGGNPHFKGNEFLAATFADFELWGRGLSDEELRRSTDPTRNP